MRRLAPSLLALLLAWAAVLALLLLLQGWGPTRDLWAVMLWGGWLLPVAWFGMVVPAVLLAPRGRPHWWPPTFAVLGAVAGTVFTWAVLAFVLESTAPLDVSFLPLLAAGAATGLLTALFHLRLEHPRERRGA